MRLPRLRFATGTRVIALALSAFTATAAEPRHPDPVLDPSSLEGILFARIRTEPDDQNRLVLLKDFAFVYPKSKALRWVLESIHSIYLERKDYRASMEAGDRVMKWFPSDLDTPLICLKTAETVNDFELTRRYAYEIWKRASWRRKSPGADGDEAREAMDKAELALATLALQSSSPALRQEAMSTLARLNPESLYLPTAANSTADRTAVGVSVRPQPSVPPAIKDNPFQLDLEKEDVLLAEAERLTRRGDSYPKVLDYSRRLIKMLQSQTGPSDGLSIEDWKARRERRLAAAHFMSGMASTVLGQYSAADRDLRAALPALQSNRPALGLTLYSLGYVNYRLAEDGDRKRVFDALKFNEQCATIPGPYRDQAARNNESIRVYYNMK